MPEPSTTDIIKGASPALKKSFTYRELVRHVFCGERQEDREIQALIERAMSNDFAPAVHPRDEEILDAYAQHNKGRSFLKDLIELEPMHREVADAKKHARKPQIHIHYDPKSYELYQALADYTGEPLIVHVVTCTCTRDQTSGKQITLEGENTMSGFLKTVKDQPEATAATFSFPVSITNQDLAKIDQSWDETPQGWTYQRVEVRELERVTPNKE